MPKSRPAEPGVTAVVQGDREDASGPRDDIAGTFGAAKGGVAGRGGLSAEVEARGAAVGGGGAGACDVGEGYASGGGDFEALAKAEGCWEGFGGSHSEFSGLDEAPSRNTVGREKWHVGGRRHDVPWGHNAPVKKGGAERGFKGEPAKASIRTS